MAREIHDIKDVTLNNVPEGGGNDDQHGEGVLGQGGGAGSRWGEELEKGDFFLSNSSSS